MSISGKKKLKMCKISQKFTAPEIGEIGLILMAKVTFYMFSEVLSPILQENLRYFHYKWSKNCRKGRKYNWNFFFQKSHLKKFKDSIFTTFFVWNSKPQVPHVIFSQYLAFFAVESSQILNSSDLVFPLAQKSMNFSNICP